MKSISFVTALALVAAGAARADIAVFDNEAGFIAAAPNITTTTFDNLPDFDVQLSIEFNGMKFATPGRWQMPGICSVDRSLGASSIAPRHITFLKDGAESSVRAFGFLLTTIVISPPGDYQAIVFTADGQQKAVPIEGVTFDLPAYRGFIATSPITDVIVQAIGTSQFNFCFDNVSHSALR